jgi:uncharacterized membrane protein YcaP (DUF421 family)
MDQIEVFDFHRIFLGNAPLSFLLEIVFRTVIMYGYTILLLRLLGKRGMGQLSSLEVAIIVCFGSAIGDPMIGAEVPILHGIVAVTTISFLQIGMERVINKHKKIEEMMEGKAECLVDDGIIITEALKRNNLSHEDLFRSLRNNEVEHLGQVKKAYFETSGDLSVIFNLPKQVKQGLSVMPLDQDLDKSIFNADDIVSADGTYCCTNCGNSRFLKKDKKYKKCKICLCENWVNADG